MTGTPEAKERMSIDRSEKVAETLLRLEAVTLNPNEPYTFASGIRSPIYVDCRLLMGYPDERGEIANLFAEAIESTGTKFDVIAGTTTAGIPHAAWASDRLKLPMIYVRSGAKDHGKQNQIEGPLKNGQRVAVVEDLVSTGKSSIETIRAVREAGGEASHIFAIITYGFKESNDNFKSQGIRLTSLTTFVDVVRVAERMGYIAKKDIETVLDWAKDPYSWWGKRAGIK